MKPRAGGFTLIEVLVAVSLLAAALALAFGILRASGATVARGEAMSARSETIRAVSAFLRSRIAGAQGVVFAFDPQSGKSLRFSGDQRSMRFVADLPGYMPQGGPRVHALAVAGQPDALELEVAFLVSQGGQLLPAARPPEALAAGLRSVRFDYRSLDAQGRLQDWQPRWEAADALPQQVRVRVDDAGGPWPEMIVNLTLAPSFSAAGREARQ